MQVTKQLYLLIIKRLIVVLITAAAICPSVHAQALSISGTVSDRDGIVVGAAIVLQKTNGASQSTTTGIDGKYSFGSLSSGDYEIDVQQAGFAPAKRSITLGREPLTIDIELQVSGVSTAITVTGEPGLTVPLDVPTSAGSRLNLASIDMPASVTTLSGSDILMRDDPSVNAAVTRAVGVTTNLSTGGAGNGVAVRGFNGSSIAFLYDGIRNEAGLGNIGWPFDPFMVESIDVLNGPASVLYGVGGIGGAINVIPHKPDRHRETFIRLSGGSFNTFRLSADTTGELTDSILYRVTASRQQSDGYVDRGNWGSTSVSGALTFIHTPKLRSTLVNDFAFIRPFNYNGVPLINGVPPQNLWSQNYASLDSDVHFDENSSRFETTWTPTPDWTVKNVASWLYGFRLWRQGGTQLTFQPALDEILRNGYGIYQQRQFQFDDEVDATLVKPFLGMQNTFTAGSDAEHTILTRYVTTWPGKSTLLPVLVSDPGLYPASGALLGPAQKNVVERYSVYADDRLRITRRLSVVAGLRYDNEHVIRYDLVTVGTRAGRTYNPVDSRVGAVYALGGGLNVYAQYSQATDALSNVCCISASQLGFKPAHGEQEEAGFKQAAFSGRLQWTLAAYRIVKTNLLIPNPFSLTLLEQVGSQSSKGVEANVSYNLRKGFVFGANGTILRPRFDNFIESVSGVGVSRDGKWPTNVPSASANLFATAPVHKKWTAQGTLRYVGTRYLNNANTIPMPSYVVVDAGLRWSIGERTAIDFRGANLFNRFYTYNYSSNANGSGSFLMGAPRSGEIVFSTRF